MNSLIQSVRESMFEGSHCTLYGRFNNDIVPLEKIMDRLNILCGQRYSLEEYEILYRSNKSQDRIPIRLLHCDDNKWIIRYMGIPDGGKQRHANVTHILDINVYNGDPLSWMLAIGLTPYKEFIRAGYRYFARNNIHVRLYRLYGLLNQHSVESLQLVDDESMWIIEFVLYLPEEENVNSLIQESTADVPKTEALNLQEAEGELIKYASYIADLVPLEKLPTKAFRS